MTTRMRAASICISAARWRSTGALNRATNTGRTMRDVSQKSPARDLQRDPIPCRNGT
jgi:hypothetical protein